jgi:hypothetical protein
MSDLKKWADHVTGKGKQKRKRAVVMKEFSKGELHSGSGGIVKDPEQAVAITYAVARKRKK